jgi:surfactin synthase thioesterase subunit
LGGFSDESSRSPYWRMVLPALEADATLYRHFIYSEDAPFDFPIRAYGGRDDENIRREHLDGWAEQTTGSFVVRLFPGGHFYHTGTHGLNPDFVQALTEDLS